MSFPPGRTTRRGSWVALVATCAALSLAAPTAQAAEPVARPVANADSYAVYASGEYLLDVLANDDTTALSSGDLTLCGVGVSDEAGRVLYAEIDRDDPTRVYLETNRNADGVVSFTYDACQGKQRTTTTVTLDITRLVTPKVTKPRKRGRITATNPNEATLQILWGSNRTSVSDGRRSIASGRRITIKVSRTRVYWVAYLVDQGSVIVAGEGTVSKIRRARRR